MAEQPKKPLLHRVGEAAAELGREPPSHPAVRLLFQLGIPALVFGFLAFTVVTQWHELTDQDLRLDPIWLGLAVPLLIAVNFIWGLIWVLQLRMLGQRPPSLPAQDAWAKSLLARYVPGSVLLVITRVVLTERQGVPRRVTVTAMAYELGFQFASAAAFAACFLLSDPDSADPWLRWVALAAVPASLAALHPRVFEPIVNRTLRMMGRSEIPVLLKPRQMAALFGYYAAMWALTGLAMFFVARAIYPAGWSDWGLIAAAQAIAYCAGVLSLVFPGGLGIRDGAFAWAIRGAVPSSSLAVAAAIALMARLAITLGEVLYFAALTLLMRRVADSAAAEAPAATRAAAVNSQT